MGGEHVCRDCNMLVGTAHRQDCPRAWDARGHPRVIVTKEDCLHDPMPRPAAVRIGRCRFCDRPEGSQHASSCRIASGTVLLEHTELEAVEARPQAEKIARRKLDEAVRATEELAAAEAATAQAAATIWLAEEVQALRGDLRELLATRVEFR